MQADDLGEEVMMFAARTIPSALRALLAAALVATGINAHAGSVDTSLPGEVLVQLRTTAALDPLLGKFQLGVIGQFGARPIYRLQLPVQANVDDTVAALLQESDVVLAEPNVVHSTPEARRIGVWAIGTPTDYTTQWAPQALRLAEAQQLSTGAGVRVAVLDTGVDRSHPALAGRLLPGFDFVDFDSDPSEMGTVADLGFGHGTHVAGLVAMVAPGAMIMPLRVLDPSGQGNTWVLAEAMLYAVDPDGNPSTDDGAHVINLSLGGTVRTRMFDTIAKLAACELAETQTSNPTDDTSDPGYDEDKNRCTNFGGAVIAAAAGNDASDAVRQYPAAEGAYGLLAVAASNANSSLADFSNFGSWIDVAAPGEGVTSSVPGGGYGTWSGTSMATPLVAGTAALLRALNPGMMPDDVVKRLKVRSSPLCGGRLRQIDAAAALLDTPSPATNCP
jgi:subtilisin family serine protease